MGQSTTGAGFFQNDDALHRDGRGIQKFKVVNVQ